MTRLLRLCLTLALGLALLPGVAAAHPGAHPGDEDRDGISFEEDFPGEGVAWEKQHPGDEGHLDPVDENVNLLGKARMEPKVPLDEDEDDTGCDPEADTCEAPVSPEKDAMTGRIADVAAWGNYAYLAAFREPVCDGGGFFVVDISDPANPVEVEDAFRPAAPGNYVGEGMQVIDVDTPTFTGQILLHNNEVCDYTIEPNFSGGGSGMSMWDVTDPTDPQPLSENFGDFTVEDEGTQDEFTYTHSYHSARAWEQDGRVFVVGVDNEDVYDIDIFDVTNPTTPILVAETGLPDFEEAEQDPPPHGNTAFHHDVMHYFTQGESRLLVSYWDAGYLWLNVDDPENPEFIDATDFADVEPFAEELGFTEPLPPEGNAHQAELSPDETLFIGADEDFNPYRILSRIASGPFDGTEFSATQGAGTPQIGPGVSVQGPTVFVGPGCADMPAATSPNQIAIAERGGPDECAPFTAKAANIEAAGYAAGIVMNNVRDDCRNLVNMLIEGDIPMLFVNRPTGLRILGQDPGDNPCAMATPAAVGDAGSDIDASAVFDGWGYVALYDAETMEPLDYYAIEESLDPEFAEGFGDLSVHEVAMDPNRPGRAYLAYYSGGLRVLDYSAESGLTEVGAFIDEGGNNFWGVEFHELPDGRELVLASDRDYGLYIFDPVPLDKVTRLSGATRLQTAVAISQDSYGDGEAATVVLARSDIYPDALAGAPLAVAEDGPLLLTPPDSLHEVVADEIERVLPEGSTIYLLGGTAALDESVEAAVVALGYEVERVAGTTRIETAIEIAGELGDPDTLLVTTGYDFPDALAAGAAAGHVSGAVLLTTADEPHDAVDEYLDDRDDADVYAVGGPAVRAYPDLEPVSGATREHTAVAVADEFFDEPNVVGVARRDRFPDALAGGAHIARLGGPILLTPTDNLHSAPAGYLCAQSIDRAYVYGGAAAIDAATADAINRVVDGIACRP